MGMNWIHSSHRCAGAPELNGSNGAPCMCIMGHHAVNEEKGCAVSGVRVTVYVGLHL